jgi:CheY-like chemotaxis protein
MTLVDLTEIPAGISEPEWEYLQQLFFEEGIERSRELLAVPDNCFDARKIGHQMHQWAGSARQLGFHRIAESALSVELLLANVPVRETDIRERLSDLLLEFCALRSSRRVPVPEHLAEALRGKSVALIGFPQAEAERVCTALWRVDARARLFTAADNLHAESVRECDLVVFRVGPETDGARLRAAAEGLVAGKLLLAGGRRYLMALPLAIHSLVGEYLVENWEAEELLLRLALAISRKETATTVSAGLESSAGRATEGHGRISSPTVLIVDDDPVIRTLLRTTLRSYGLGCEAIDNGRDALRMIREEKPHAVVLDVNMPGLDGYGVLSAIRAENLPTVVVMLSARQQEEDVLRGFRLGADDYLVKPFSPPELVARIKRLLLLTAKAA